MATVTGITKERADEIWNASVVGGEIDENGQLLLVTRGGTIINAGAIISPAAAVEKAHPVGSIYITTVPTNPGLASVLGVGTWARWGQGRIPVSQSSDTSFDVVEEIGGSKTATLVDANIPIHTHSLPDHTHGLTASYTVATNTTFDGTGTRITSWNFGTASDVQKSGTTAPGGAGTSGAFGSASPTPVSILPPYIVAYFWKRTG